MMKVAYGRVYWELTISEWLSTSPSKHGPWQQAGGHHSEEAVKTSHLKTQPQDSISQQRESFETSKCSLSNAPPLEAIPSNPFQVFPLTEDQALKYPAAILIQTTTVSVPYEQRPTVG